MRRVEFISGLYQKEVFDHLIQLEVGYLGISDSKGFARPVPLQFVYHDSDIYFHGADVGEKFQVFTKKSMVSFSMIKPLSMMPSYWTTKDYACPATSYYLSAYGRGKGELVEDLNDKALYLNKIMEKYQKEGGYIPIDANLPLYKKALKETAVFRIKSLEWDIKCKVGQNLMRAKRESIMEHLNTRAADLDNETIYWMKLLNN
jgi:nitroimidazol reductase NimA-like FMN-containing flavoprotein (pyridoxamine 5'-phosphate oxidase superfamily)